MGGFAECLDMSGLGRLTQKLLASPHFSTIQISNPNFLPLATIFKFDNLTTRQLRQLPSYHPQSTRWFPRRQRKRPRSTHRPHQRKLLDHRNLIARKGSATVRTFAGYAGGFSRIILRTSSVLLTKRQSTWTPVSGACCQFWGIEDED